MREHPTYLPSLEAYAAWTDPCEDGSTELVRGLVVRQPRPSIRHGRIQATLAMHLGQWVRAAGCGEVFVESGVVLAERPPTVRGPDVGLLLAARRVGDDPGGWIRGAPDLAVEVLSPTDRVGPMRRKVRDYLDGGASRVWVVDPVARTVTVHRPDGERTVVEAGGRLEDPELLPGFSVALEDLLADS